jgi:hypothetical protein
VFPRFTEKIQFERDDLLEVDFVVAKLRNGRDGRGGEKVLLQQSLRRDEERISREGRQTPIRRVTEAWRIERKNLPDVHPRAGGPIEEPRELVAKVADAVTAGKRGRMKESAGCTLASGVMQVRVRQHQAPASGLIESSSPRASNSSSHRAA